MTDRLLPWLLLALALAVGAAGTMYHLWDEADERADRFEAAYITEKANVLIVDRVKEVEKQVFIRVPVIQRNLERLCNAEGDGSGAADGAPEAEAGDVRAGGVRPLGPEIAESLSELERLWGLQDSVTAAGCAPE